MFAADRITVPIDISLTPELERDEISEASSDLAAGTGSEEGDRDQPPAIASSPKIATDGFVAHIAEQPVGFRLSAVFAAKGIPLPQEWTIYGGKYELWLVPHRVSVVRRHGLSELTSLGMQIRYLADSGPCSVVSLFPEAQFVERGRLTFRVASDAQGSLSVLGKANNLESIGGASLKIGVEASLGSALAFELAIVSPIIAAVGKGAARAEWVFERDAGPLHGRDIETWAILLLPAALRSLSYEIVMTYTRRFAFFPTRHESAPVKVDCTLVDEFPETLAAPQSLTP